MNIIVNVNNQDYQLKNGTGDVVLNRYYGQKKSVVKEETKMIDSVKIVGYFKNTFDALAYIVSDQELNNEVTSLLGLKELYENTIKDVRRIAKQLQIEG